MTLKFLLAAAAGAAAFALSAPAGDAKSPLPGREGHQCFLASLADGFAAPDQKHLYVRTSPRDVYAFEMFGICNDLDWAHRIALMVVDASDVGLVHAAI